MDIYIYISYSVCTCETAIADNSRLRNGCYSVLEFGFLGGFPSVMLFPIWLRAFMGCLRVRCGWLPSNGTCILKVLGCTQSCSFEQIKSPPSLNSINQPVSSALNFP